MLGRAVSSRYTDHAGQLLGGGRPQIGVPAGDRIWGLRNR